MSGVFKKLNLTDQSEILVVNAPESFQKDLKTLRSVNVRKDPKTAKAIPFAIAFVTKQKEVDSLAKTLASKAEGDAVLWFAYPKGTSKNYTCEFNRDSGWAELGKAGFEPVRQVAIDSDWSALRFRRVEYIKSMKRHTKRALTAKGRKRTKKKATTR